MGGCGSREKDMREKIGIPEREFQTALRKFSKMSAIKPGQKDESIAMEGFKVIFKENQAFAQKLFRFARSSGEVDLWRYLQLVDLFARLSMRLQHSAMRQLDQTQLIALISFQNPELLQQDPQFTNLYKQQVSYSSAGKLIKEIINMQSHKGVPLCSDDDIVPMFVVNTIFGSKYSFDLDEQSNIELKVFLSALKNFAFMNKIIKSYFEGKFYNKTVKSFVVDFKTSELLNKQIIAVFNMAVPWFQKCKSITNLYTYTSNDKFNFNSLANCLLKARSPILLIFKHIETDGKTNKEYTFGYFSASYWRLAPDMSGDRYSFIFSICPNFKIFPWQNGGQSKFAYLIPVVTKKFSQQINQINVVNTKDAGLGIGGSGVAEHRIWIDKQLNKSWIKEEDKTFIPGVVLDPEIFQLNVSINDFQIQTIEVWEIQQSTMGQSTSYFKGSQMQSSNASYLNRREDRLRSIPIIEEEDSKVQ